VDSRKIRKCLGFFPGYPLEKGWRETVLEMRQLGEL